MNDIRDAFQKAGYPVQEGQPNRVSGNPTNRQGRQGSQGQQENRGASGTLRSASPPVTLGPGYTKQAEEVIIALKSSMGRKFEKFTTSKIRNILAQVSEIYNDVVNEQGDVLKEEYKSRIEYLKVRLVYECGREPDVVKPFVEKAGLISLINDIGDSRQKFKDFARYMEALVAYHRFHGGKDS